MATVRELHELIAEEVGVSVAPEYVEARTGAVRASALDPTPAGRVLGWKPDMDLRDGIKRTVDWLRSLVDSRPTAVAAA
jgi:UDP-glucose 4-epimerase